MFLFSLLRGCIPGNMFAVSLERHFLRCGYQILCTFAALNPDMMTKSFRRISVLSLLLSAVLCVYAQQPGVSVRSGIPYVTAQFPGQDKMQKLCFDFYEPAGEADTLRPLVITLFGGGFVAGARDWADMEAWCNRFAENGYAAASIDYRLMPAKNFSSKGLIRTGFMSAQDVSAAVRFFKANSAEYHIDTNRIFLLGESAGAVAVIHMLYMDEDERPAETFEEPELPPLHSSGTPEMRKYTSGVAGAVLLWGCIFDPNMMDADEVTPVCFIHGAKDRILPADSGYAFSTPGLPYAYGSETMAKRLQKLGTVPFELHLKEQEGHAFYFKYLSMFQLDALKFDNCFQMALDFFNRQQRKS